MATYNSGKIISILREKRGFSQEELAEFADCDRATISRIESGKIYNPAKRTIENIFRALKVDHERFTSFLSSEPEIEIDEKKQNINRSIAKRDYTRAEELISELEADKHYKKNKFEQQYLLRIKATILLNSEPSNFDDVYTMLTDAIRFTVNDFCVDDIERHLYNFEEIKVINMISNLYFMMGNIQKSYEILTGLRKCLEKDYIPDMEKVKIYIMILYNLSKYTGLLGKYEEALNVCDIGIAKCIETDNLKRLPEFYYNKAFDLYDLNRPDESLELFRHVKSLCEAQQNFDLLEFTLQSVKEKFDINL